MSTISTGTRRELVRAVADRYQQGTAAEKRLILDEFVALTGYHRKHTVRVLNGTAVRPRVSTTPSTGQVALAVPLAEAPYAVDEKSHTPLRMKFA